MGEEWVEIAALWPPRNQESRLLAKGTAQISVKEGEKLLVMKNQYRTDENKQPAYRIMVVREDGDQHIDLETGESISDDEIQRELQDLRRDEAEVNPHQMG